ncbi:thiamine pyrophosphate-binding protein [Falsiroseomonas sp. HW251]|uniref:thiamine pyrophosphate-binding protein n=1 Tax=Falsiroseomonas sp. HW251 TaxID=3390998 RepID=UPI003D317B39
MAHDGGEVPVASRGNTIWGSDAMAETLRALGIRYVALNPGASYRGLHDSLVNHLGNADPKMLLCLHENVAVAVAHGFAKACGERMGVILHSNVGLLNGSMALFNAWCDRVPMLVLGATGPVDAAKRRPWIDWIHTVQDQGALIRHFVKWDAQPASIPAATEALLRADRVARTAPEAPTYVNLDAALQEAPLAEMPPRPDASRFAPPPPAVPAPDAVTQAVAMLRAATRPVLLFGRMSRSPRDWARRVALAEALSASVVSEFKVGASFPTAHPLHAGPPSMALAPQAAEALKQADLIVSFDMLDLAGMLKTAGASAKVINVSLDHLLHNGFGGEHMGLPPQDLHLACLPDIALHAIADAMGVEAGTLPGEDGPSCPDRLPPEAPLDVQSFTRAVGMGLAGERACIVRLPLSWDTTAWRFTHPMDFLGFDGGGGIGSGPGMLVGAALALRGGDRLPVAVIGDGDTLMGVQAFWTAVHYGIPLLCIVSNNRSFFNDEMHQERVAIQRGRPVENRWIGQRIAGPDIDLAAMARAQGAVGIGPVTTVGDAAVAIRDGAAQARAGGVVLVDVRVTPGYGADMAAVTRG